MSEITSGTSTQLNDLPLYRSHKEVRAAKIRYITDWGVDGASLTPADEGCGAIRVTAAYMTKHQPKEGGYYVLYKDGYESFSPAEAFEEGYARI